MTKPIQRIKQKLIEVGITIGECPCDECEQYEKCTIERVACHDFAFFVKTHEEICLKPGDKLSWKDHKGRDIIVESERIPSKRYYSRVYRETEYASRQSKRYRQKKASKQPLLKRRTKGSVLYQWGFPYNDNTK